MKMKISDERLLCLTANRRIKTPFLDRQILKVLDLCRRDILHLQPRAGQVLPMKSALPHQEGLKSRPRKSLVCRPTTDIVDSAQRNRHRICRHDDLNDILALHLQMVDIGDHPHRIAHHIGNRFQKRLPIGNTDNRVALLVIRHANKHPPALGIGKPADPLEVFLPPALLVLGILIFFFSSSTFN